MNLLQQKIKDSLEKYEKRFTYASFCWSGDNNIGIALAKAQKKEFKKMLKQSQLELLEVLKWEIEKIDAEKPSHDVCDKCEVSGSTAFMEGECEMKHKVLNLFKNLDEKNKKLDEI